MSRAASYAPLALAALAALAVIVTSSGGLDVSLSIGSLRFAILLNTASSLALVALAGAAFVTRGSDLSASPSALALGALATVTPAPALLLIAASLAAGARPAVVAALGAAAVVGGAPDHLSGLNAEHALGVLLALIGLLSARGPLAPLMLLIITSRVAPVLWASGWGRVALISGGVGVATLTAVGATLDKSRAASCLGWSWVGLGVAAMGAAAAPLGLALGLAGLGVATLSEPTAADGPQRPSRWALVVVALAVGVLPNVGVGGGRDVLLGLIVSGDPLAAAGVLFVSAATGYCFGRASPARLSPAALSLVAAPLMLGLSRWLSPTVALPRAELQLVGALAGAVTLGAGLFASRGGRLPQRELPTLQLRPWPVVFVAPTLSPQRLTQALSIVALALWACWTLNNAVVHRDTILGPLWDR